MYNLHAAVDVDVDADADADADDAASVGASALSLLRPGWICVWWGACLFSTNNNNSNKNKNNNIASLPTTATTSVRPKKSHAPQKNATL